MYLRISLQAESATRPHDADTQLNSSVVAHEVTNPHAAKAPPPSPPPAPLHARYTLQLHCVLWRMSQISPNHKKRVAERMLDARSRSSFEDPTHGHGRTRITLDGHALRSAHTTVTRPVTSPCTSQESETLLVTAVGHRELSVALCRNNLYALGPTSH